MKRTVFALLVITALLVASGVQAEPNIKEGKWEITTVTQVKGMEGMKIPSQTNYECITKKDPVPRGSNNPDCTVVETKFSGDTVSWLFRCKGQEGFGESRGKITYKADRFDGTVTTVTARPGEEKVELVTRMSGRRVGECK
jgi:hypothetical protein